jgi:nitrate reductase (NAD(P)H)
MHAGWWFDPDWIINELGINSTITSPAHEEVVTLDSQKDYVIRGYAYSSALC